MLRTAKSPQARRAEEDDADGRHEERRAEGRKEEDDSYKWWITAWTGTGRRWTVRASSTSFCFDQCPCNCNLSVT